MATSKLPAPSPRHDQSSSSAYTGELINSLIEIVEKAEEKYSTPADGDENVEPERGSAPLTIDEVLERSGILNRNPYLELVERVMRGVA